MIKTVSFCNTKNNKFNVHIGLPSDDDLIEPTPKEFDNDEDDHARLIMVDDYIMFFVDDDRSKPPVMYFRHNNIEYYRFGGFVKMGKDYITPQNGHYHDGEVATKDTPVIRYHKISDEPLAYRLETEDPFSEFTYYKDYSTWKEGNFFEVKAEAWPWKLVEHESMYPNLSEIWQPATITGIFDGKPIKGVGSYDRVYMRRNCHKDVGEDQGYIYVNMIGIREDGKKEQCCLNFEQTGKAVAFYCLEGEEPIITDEASMESEWVRLPYTDDGTCTYQNATFRFADKEIHFIGKWGTKGFTPNPRIERHGQSHVFGTWYAGDKEYQHTYSLAFSEHMEAYDYKLEKLGFDIIDY